MRNFSLAFLLIMMACAANAQTGPHLASLYPSGAQAGSTVDVSVKGGGLVGVKRFLFSGGPGITGQLVGSANTVDETSRPLFESKCSTCHEARSPDNRSMTPEQWAATVTRMITQHSADISDPDKTKIVGYLQGLSRAGEITAKITVAPGMAPGLREFRLLTDHGISSATCFEVGNVPEVSAQKSTTGKPEDAQSVKLPIIVNGVMAQSGERDWFRFDVKKGQRLTFNLKAERLNAESAAFFFPTLYLYDPSGKEVAKNLGKYGVDPAFDYVAPQDGSYLLVVHDLLWHGAPASVYRLTMGTIAADGILSPAWARPGADISARLVSTGEGESTATSSAAFAVRAPMNADGMTTVATPAGDMPLLVRNLPDGGTPRGLAGAAVPLPALFRGNIAQANQTDTFHVAAPHGGSNIEIYAQRLGSPLRAHVIVRNIAGDIVAEKTADSDLDLTVPNAFPKAGDYTVDITDADGNAGPGYVYYWEAGSGDPTVQLTVTPDLVNLAPGTSIAFLVRDRERRNIVGPITVHADGLPAGVIATDAVLLPDSNEAVIVVSASPGAPTSAGGFVEITGTALGAANPAGASKSFVRTVAPVELYMVGNNQMMIPRTTTAVAVETSAPPFSLALPKGQMITIGPKDTQIQLVVDVVRKAGFKGSLYVSAQGLPNGISPTQQNVNIRADQTQATLTFNLNRNTQFFKSTSTVPNPPIRFVVAGFPATINNDIVAITSTPAITLVNQ